MSRKRFWYQSMIVMSDLNDYHSNIQRRLSSYVSNDSQVDVYGAAPGSFPVNYPGPDIAYDVFYRIHSLQFMLAATEAERRGYDAYVIGNVGSPLIREIRSLVNIPVIGYGDAAARMAGFYGRSFGIMVFNVERMESLAERYRDWNLGESYAGAYPSGVTFNEVAAAHGNPALRPDVIAKFRASAERFVTEKSVDVIIPGEMPLNLLLADEKISSVAGATIVDGMAVLMKTADMMVDLARTSGMTHSRRGYYNIQPSSQRVSEIFDFYGLTDLQKRIANQDKP